MQKIRLESGEDIEISLFSGDKDGIFLGTGHDFVELTAKEALDVSKLLADYVRMLKSEKAKRNKANRS